MSSGNDYNWEMTGAPDPSVAWTDPNAAESWNNYAEQKNAESGGAGQPLPTISEHGTFVAPEPSKEPPVWLRPEDYVTYGYAAPYTQEQIKAGANLEDIRQGYGGLSYATLAGKSNFYEPAFAGEYLVDPKSGKFVLDESGNPIGLPRPNVSGTGFGDFIADKLIPGAIALGAAGTGLGAAGLIGAGGTALGAPALAATGEVGLLSNPLVLAAVKGAGMGALTGGVTSALTGQDALKGALIGGATGGILGGGEAALFPEAAQWAQGSIANSGLLGAGRGAAGGAINTLLGGGDLQKNVMYGAGLGGALGAGTEYFFPSAQAQPPQGEPRWASVADSLQNANQSLDYFNNLKYGDVSNMGYAGTPYSGEGLNPAVRTGGGYDVLSPEYITNRGAYGAGGYKGVGLDPAIEQLYSGLGLNPNLNYNTAGLANTAEALSQASGVDINRAEFAGRGGLTADQEAALDRALTAADYPTPSNWFSGLGNLGTMLGLGALGRGMGGGAGKAAGALGGSYVPKGMVDYSGILNLLAPKTSTRSSLLG